MKIGIMNKGITQMPFKEMVLLCKEIGATGIQPFITHGQISPVMTKSERKAAAAFLKEQEMDLPAVCADFGAGFFSEENNEAGIHRLIAMIDMAVDMGTAIVSTHIGHIPDDENDPEYQKKLETFKIVGKYADDLGVYLAVETGRETPEVLKKFLLSTGCKSATVNLDPANLAMCIGSDPVEAVYTLGDLIVHTHIKDGIKTGETSYMEVPLGEGSVDFPRYLNALQDIGYDGYLTIERGSGEDRVSEIRKAFDFISKELKQVR